MKTAELPRKKACLVLGCHKQESDKPMCFKGEKYCSENHRKILARENRI